MGSLVEKPLAVHAGAVAGIDNAQRIIDGETRLTTFRKRLKRSAYADCDTAAAGGRSACCDSCRDQMGTDLEALQTMAWASPNSIRLKDEE